MRFEIRQESDGVDRVHLVESIDEDSGRELQALLELLRERHAPTVVFDFGRVTLVNSLGVRAWVQFIRSMGNSQKELFLDACPPSVMLQIDVVPNFLGRAQILSYCPNQERETQTKSRPQKEGVWDAALLERFEAHRDFTRVLIDGFALVSRQRKILRFNQAFCAMLALDASEILEAATIDELFLTPIQGSAKNAMELVMKAHEPIRVDEVIGQRQHDRSLMQLIVSGYPFLDDEGEFLGACVVFRDLTAESNLHAKYVELQRLAAIAHTTQMLAHDVRRPFVLMKTALELLAEARNPEQVERVLRVAKRDVVSATETVEGLIQDILELGGKRELVRETVSLVDLMDVAIESTLRIYPKSEVKIETDFAAMRHPFVDSGKILRVLLNIIGNAFQALNGKGRLRIGSRDLRENGSWIQVTIGNDGPLIAEADLHRVFDAHFTRSKRGGIGLGLSIARKVILDHGGKIWCESSADSGVLFHFTLPCE